MVHVKARQWVGAKKASATLEEVEQSRDRRTVSPLCSLTPRILDTTPEPINLWMSQSPSPLSRRMQIRVPSVVGSNTGAVGGMTALFALVSEPVPHSRLAEKVFGGVRPHPMALSASPVGKAELRCRTGQPVPLEPPLDGDVTDTKKSTDVPRSLPVGDIEFFEDGAGRSHQSNIKE